MDWSKLLFPKIAVSQRLEYLPFIGAEIYKELQTDYQQPSSLLTEAHFMDVQHSRDHLWSHQTLHVLEGKRLLIVHRLQVLCLNRQQQQPLLELVRCAF